MASLIFRRSVGQGVSMNQARPQILPPHNEARQYQRIDGQVSPSGRFFSRGRNHHNYGPKRPFINIRHRFKVNINVMNVQTKYGYKFCVNVPIPVVQRQDPTFRCLYKFLQWRRHFKYSPINLIKFRKFLPRLRVVKKCLKFCKGKNYINLVPKYFAYEYVRQVYNKCKFENAEQLFDKVKGKIFHPDLGYICSQTFIPFKIAKQTATDLKSVEKSASQILNSSVSKVGGTLTKASVPVAKLLTVSTVVKNTSTLEKNLTLSEPNTTIVGVNSISENKLLSPQPNLELSVIPKAPKAPVGLNSKAENKLLSPKPNLELTVIPKAPKAPVGLNSKAEIKLLSPKPNLEPSVRPKVPKAPEKSVIDKAKSKSIELIPLKKSPVWEGYPVLSRKIGYYHYLPLEQLILYDGHYKAFGDNIIGIDGDYNSLFDSLRQKFKTGQDPEIDKLLNRNLDIWKMLRCLRRPLVSPEDSMVFYRKLNYSKDDVEELEVECYLYVTRYHAR